MAIIISNKKLDEDNSDAKVIIMYFTMDYYKSNFLTTVNESIAQVIKSDAFKAYMED